jgi:membrane protein DedA with SNARE-associated domain
MMEVLAYLKASPHMAYLFVFLGSLIEGETIILTASGLAAAGYLSIRKIWILAFITTLILDQALFFLGRFFLTHPSKPLSERFPKLYKKSKRVVVLLKKNETWFILVFRFVYGIRAISPIVIGLCGISPRRFMPLNAIAAFLWATLSCGLGFWLGNCFTGKASAHNPFHYVQLGILVVIISLILFFFIRRWLRLRWER